MISNASDLHGYTVRALYRALQASTEQVISVFPSTRIIFNSKSLLSSIQVACHCVFKVKFVIQESLVRVAIWCIGEYGDMLVNNVGMLNVEDPITVSVSFLRISLN